MPSAVMLCVCVSSLCSSPSLLTNDVQVAGDLLGAEAVGDLADVVATVLQPQVTDGEAGEVARPAGVTGQRAAVLQPADGGVGVAGGGAGELHTSAHLHLPSLETVQHGWRRLRGV